MPASEQQEAHPHEQSCLEQDTCDQVRLLNQVEGDDCLGGDKGMRELSKEREDRQESRQREEHGTQGLPSLSRHADGASFQWDRWAKHRGTEGTPHDEDATERQQEVCRTEYGLQVYLEAKESVPHQVADASKGEQRDTQQRGLITCWHGVFPGKAVNAVEDKGNDQDQSIHEIGRVEDRMPGGEKGSVY